MAVRGCPVEIEEWIELYCLDRLTACETKRVEAHLAACPDCFQDAMDEDLFLAALRAALLELDLEERVWRPLRGVVLLLQKAGGATRGRLSRNQSALPAWSAKRQTQPGDF